MWRKWVGEKLIMDKIEKFKEELELIKNEKIRKFAESAIEIMPDYFFVIPASSTGKYHSKYALGEGGLLRHTKAVVRFAYELFRLSWWKFTDDEKDLLLVAAILHDGWKSGRIKQKFTVAEHPLIATQELTSNFLSKEFLSEKELQFVIDAINTHMGEWNKDYKTNKEILPLPKTKYQKFLHLCDYVVSRKMFEEVNFDIGASK